MAYFEATPEQKQLAALGRKMINFSEYYPSLKGLKDEQVRVLNELSRIGGMLITVGVPGGTTIKSFSHDDLVLVDQFMNGRLALQAETVA